MFWLTRKYFQVPYLLIFLLPLGIIFFWPFDNGGEDIKREVIGFDFFKDLPTVAKLYFAKLFPSLF